MIQIIDVYKIYNKNQPNEFIALKNVNLTIKEGEFVAIMGKSGAGKSTLMHLIGGIDKPTQGSIIIEGQDLSKFTDREQAKFRNQKVGIILQEFYLLNESSVLDNVLLPLQFMKHKNGYRLERATELIYGVNLENHINKKICTLSGGEKQRVAVARALSNSPNLLLADEPTGSLDSSNADEIMGMLTRLNSKGKTIILITHDIELAHKCKRIIELKDGEIINDTNVVAKAL